MTDRHEGNGGGTDRRRCRLEIGGAVQGVGFRPFVYRAAHALGLTGWVGNSPEGVIVEAEGDAARLAALARTIRESPPPNASVLSVDSHLGSFQVEYVQPRAVSGTPVYGL